MSTPTPPTGYGAMPPTPAPQRPGGPAKPPQGNPWPLVVGLGALALVLVIGAIVTASVLVMRSDSGDSAAGASPAAMPTAMSAAPSQPAPSAPPSVSQSQAMSDDKLTTADFQGDWNFQLGGVLLDADYVSSRDYPTCGPIASPKIEHIGCRYGALWIHDARGGRLRMARAAYVFHSDAEAKQAAKEAKEADLQLPADSEIKDFADGKWLAKAYTKVMIVTFVTAAKGIPAKDIQDYVHYGEADYGSALLFMTIS